MCVTRSGLTNPQEVGPALLLVDYCIILYYINIYGKEIIRPVQVTELSGYWVLLRWYEEHQVIR